MSLCIFSKVRSYETDNEDECWKKIYKCKKEATHIIKKNADRTVSIKPGKKYCKSHVKVKYEHYVSSAFYGK